MYKVKVVVSGLKIYQVYNCCQKVKSMHVYDAGLRDSLPLQPPSFFYKAGMHLTRPYVAKILTAVLIRK